ncbi:MAG: tail fiber protein [Bacteroidota bacterium]
MKNILTTIILLLTVTFLVAQQIPFQGKLLENGTPISGSRNFTLSINQGNINWSETQSNIPVVNGLYNLILGSVTPLPKDLFNDSQSVTLGVSVNGQALSDVVIFLPFGVRWKADGASNVYFEDGNLGVGTDSPQEEVHIKGEGSILNLEGDTHAFMEFYPDGYSSGRKGFLGYSSGSDGILLFQNEVDKLQLRSNTALLTLDTDGFVGIGFNNPIYKLDVNGGIKIGNTSLERAGGIRFQNGDFQGYDGSNWVSFLSASAQGETFTVGSVETSTETGLEQSTFNTSTTTNLIWQSFSLLESNPLESIEVNLANSTSVDVRLRIYEGEGNSTQAIFDHTYNASTVTSTLQLQSFDIATHAISPLLLNAGTVYTFQVEGVGDDLTFRVADNNPYEFGRMNTATQSDAVFKINVRATDGYNLEVKSDSTIVGNDLYVEGRVKDQFGYVNPVGTINAFGGAAAPEGWLVCDGSAVRRDLYADLFVVIGTNWGAGDGSTTFNLPDLRGQFLRGVSGSSSEDPNRNNRTAKYSGGNTGNNTGSYQSDEFRSHNHTYNDIFFSQGINSIPNGISSTSVPQDFGTRGEPDFNNVGAQFLRTSSSRGGSETRPKNAYVNYIIKY